MHDLIFCNYSSVHPAQLDTTTDASASPEAAMSNHKDAVNPLRPYYIPPTIGEAPDTASAAAPFPRNGNATASSGYASKARDMFQDLDYNYMGDSPPTMVQNLKDLIDELLWKYTSVLMAQPFEVAKTILQTRDQDPNAGLAPSQTPGPLISRSTSYAESIREVRDYSNSVS